MHEPGTWWTLYAGDELVAELEVLDGDVPWLAARVVAHPGFDALRPLFAAEMRALERDDEDAVEQLYADIREAVRLVYPHGGTVPEFLLHIDGDHAWWRWLDAPFDTDEPDTDEPDTDEPDTDEPDTDEPAK